jgi:hypothetical protein
MEHQRWDRLVLDREPPAIDLEPGEAVREMLELAMEGEPEKLVNRCLLADEQDRRAAIASCRAVAGYIALKQCSHWPVTRDDLRLVTRKAARVRTLAECREARYELMPAMGETAIMDFLSGALRSRGLPEDGVPAWSAVAVALLVTARMLAASREPGMSWRRHLKWTCDVLRVADHRSLSDIPALMPFAATAHEPD